MALTPLKVKKAPQTCRRVYLCDNVVVRPRSQLYAPARSTLDVVTVSRGDDWLLEAKQLHPGVLAASTLLPDHHGIAVCVVNTTQEPYVLPGDTCLGELSRVDVSAASVQSVPAPLRLSLRPLPWQQLRSLTPIPELKQTLPEELIESSASSHQTVV